MIVLLLLTLIRPNPAHTPGLTRPLSLHTVCTTRWGTDRRFVTQAMKKQVFADYGIPWANHSAYEVDHVIPRSLAGADSVLNLWPQSWTGANNAHMKDALEVNLGKRVCRGEMSLAFAQEAIRSDWVAAYRLYVGVK